MTLLTRRHFSTLAAGMAGASLAAPALAQSLTKVKFILNWRYQGPQCWFFIAEDKGYFRQAGLDVTMDQGDGSGAAIVKVASGAYEIGFGDINALIQLIGSKPKGEDTPLCVSMPYNRPPFCIAVPANSPIKTPKDLEGKTLGGPANDSALKLFPAFTKLTGVDPSKVTITNMAPNLREQMLKSGQVAGVFGFENTIRFSAKLIGMDPDKDIRYINYGDYGMDLYSNAIVVSRKFAAAQPEALKGFLKAVDMGIKDTLKDYDAAIETVAKREPLINKAIEKERLIATLKGEMSHPEGAKVGLGAVDPERFKKSIAIVAEANGLPRVPAPEEVFTDAFLPPLADRIKTLG